MCPHNNSNPLPGGSRAQSSATAIRTSQPMSAPACITPLRRPHSTGTTPGACSHTRQDPEHEMNPRLSRFDVFVAATCFALIATVAFAGAAWHAARQWFALKRVCAWCKIRMGGNPFAKASHGICPICAAGMKSQITQMHAGTFTRNTLALLLVLGLPCAAWSIPDEQAVRAIVGESANQGRTGMIAVAGAIRNRGTLRGVYGLNNPIVDRQPARVWHTARLAWAISRTNDITRGATHWENIGQFGRPRWASALIVTTNIGAHTFYK